MQQRGMAYARAAADAMFACNRSRMGGVALDIFQGLVVESGGLRAAPGARFIFNAALEATRRERGADAVVQLLYDMRHVYGVPPDAVSFQACACACHVYVHVCVCTCSY